MAEREPYDRSAKWLLQHHGDAILRLGGVGPVQSWRALQTDVVHPRRLPDGLLEVTFADRAAADLFLIEVATYPERRLTQQVTDDICLVMLERRTLPEVLTIVLALRGPARIDTSHEVTSRLAWTRLAAAWRAVLMWELSAEQLLVSDDVGLVPWVPLTQFSESPEALLKECRRRIDRWAPAHEHANLLAVTQALTGLRYDEPRLLGLLGGKPMILESPVIQEVVAEARHQDILEFLAGRFGGDTTDIAALLRTVRDKRELDELVQFASRCESLDDFRSRLGQNR